MRIRMLTLGMAVIFGRNRRKSGGSRIYRRTRRKRVMICPWKKERGKRRRKTVL